MKCWQKYKKRGKKIEFYFVFLLLCPPIRITITYICINCYLPIKNASRLSVNGGFRCE